MAINIARSRNPGARGLIKNDSVGLAIVFDLPPSLQVGNQSSYTQWNLLGGAIASGTGLGQVVGGGVMMQAGTKQVWAGTSPTSMHLPIQLDAETSSFDEVHNIGVMITMLGLPFEGPGGILLPPNPLRLGSDNNITAIRLGRQFYFPSVVLNSVTYSSETRISADGFPIAGTLDVMFTTDVVMSREQWRKAAGSQSAAETTLDLGNFDRRR